MKKRQDMAEAASEASRASDAARAEEMAVRQQLVALRAQTSRVQAEVRRLLRPCIGALCMGSLSSQSKSRIAPSD